MADRLPLIPALRALTVRVPRGSVPTARSVHAAEVVAVVAVAVRIAAMSPAVKSRAIRRQDQWTPVHRHR
jgi:hypothetical protein